MEYQQKEFNMIHDYRASSLLHRFFVGFPKGTVVLLPINICDIVHQVVLKSGLTPFFVDISKQYFFTINQDQIVDYLEKSKNKRSILLLNHTYGVGFKFCDFVDFLKDNFNVSIIDDKCLSIPDFVHNPKVELTLFSTGYSKFIDMGFGGLGIVKKSINLKNATRFFGDNFNSIKDLSLKDYIATIDRKKDAIINRKKTINKIYSDRLRPFMMGEEFNDWRFCINLGNKDVVLKKIFENHLFASSHYRPLNECTLRFKYAWDLYDGVINLFNDNNITEHQAYETSKIICQYGSI